MFFGILGDEPSGRILRSRARRGTASMTQGLSWSTLKLAKSSKAEKLETTVQAARAAGVRSMTLMRWIVDGQISCPRNFVLKRGRVNWLWTSDEVRKARAYAKAARRSGDRRRRFRNLR